MADDSNTSFKLDLDAHEFIEVALKAKESINSLGEVESLTALTEGILKVGGVIGILGTALFGIKETMDLVFDAENIKAIEAQFEKLSESAGVYSETLREGLAQASAGWADETDLMQAANKAMVQLQTGVKQLPELLEVARKAAALSGKDFLETFETINQAVATGNTRQLRHLNIIIDQKKAYEDHAKSIGSTVDQLTLAGRQQAVLNAVLETGKTAFNGINPNIRENQNLWTMLKVTLHEVGEVATLAFDKIAGPLVRSELSGLGAMARDLKSWFIDHFGEGAEQAKVHAENLRDKVMQLKGELIDLEQKKLHGLDFAPGDTEARIQGITQQLKEYEAELSKIEEVKKNAEKGEPGGGSSSEVSKASQIDLDKQREQKAKFAQEILRIQSEITNQEIKQMQSVAQADELYNKRRLQEVAAIDAQIAQIRAQAATGQGITEQQANQKIEALSELKKHKLIQDEAEIEKFREQALDQYVKHATSASDGIQRAFKAGAEKSKLELNDFGKLGQRVFDAYKTHSTQALLDVGAGSKDAAEAMRGFMFGAIADIAQAEGEVMMAQAFEGNFAAAAAGAGLIALAGFLRSQSQSSATTMPSTASGGSNTPYETTNYGTRTDQPPTLSDYQQNQQKQSVVINVQGSYFETEQTKMALVDLIRQNQDATQYTISTIGGT